MNMSSSTSSSSVEEFSWLMLVALGLQAVALDLLESLPRDNAKGAILDPALLLMLSWRLFPCSFSLLSSSSLLW